VLKRVLTIPSLAPNGSQDFILTAQVDDTVPHGTQTSNIATVTATDRDSNLNNNTSPPAAITVFANRGLGGNR